MLLNFTLKRDVARAQLGGSPCVVPQSLPLTSVRRLLYLLNLGVPFWWGTNLNLKSDFSYKRH
jgi:hypothetical protein